MFSYKSFIEEITELEAETQRLKETLQENPDNKNATPSLIEKLSKLERLKRSYAPFQKIKKFSKAAKRKKRKKKKTKAAD